jgi:sialate O-acetylesterase
MRKSLALTVGVFVLLSARVQADVELPAIFGDNMVLQRGREVPVWGTAEPGETVRVRLWRRTARTRADENGEWMVRLAAQEAGGPFTMKVYGDNAVEFENVMLGDVWVCSGQSNMEWPVASVRNAEEEVQAADHPDIRLFTVQKKVAQEPLRTLNGEWAECSPQTVGTFSAVGYFFGRDLCEHLGVPIGLIDSSWGGTPAEAWTRREVLEADEDFAPMLQRHAEALANYPLQAEEYEKKLREWENSRYFADPGQSEEEQAWAAPGLDASGWDTLELPVLWEKAGLNVDGVVWFRRTVTIPQAWDGKDLELHLGGIDDADVTYFNGREVGRTGMDVPEHWMTPRMYSVPGTLVEAGPAVIAVRVFDQWLDGGFRAAPDGFRLALAGDGRPDASLPLAGEWSYRLGAHREQPTEQTPRPAEPRGPDHPYSPSGLYNGMIAPLIPYGIKGAIWYQGESNAWQGYLYRELFADMIHNWRVDWDQGAFPFLFVQLANFMAQQEQPAEDSAWAELREAQLLALKLPRTGMAVITDIGEADDIHPRNKQDVGARLALAARRVAYGEDLVYSGPVFDSMQVRGSEARLDFKHVGGGLVARGGPLRGFAVAGPDRRFVWANARIRGRRVIVSSDEVDEPVAVRYNWANNPIGNLYNAEGLPASPFRTDIWPGVTFDRR